MSRVLLPEGTAPSAHIPGIDIAGKTGSAQIVSLATRAKFKNSEALNQNGWFVGFTPRRNPDVIVCVLFEGGEHGKLAARLATQVLKAYVDKQRRVPNKMVETPKSDGKVDMGALWTAPEGDKLEGGRFSADFTEEAVGAGDCCSGHGQYRVPSTEYRENAMRTNRRGKSADGGSCSVLDTGGSELMSRYVSFRDFDWLLLVLVLMICGLGVMEIRSATMHTKFAGSHIKQIYWVFAGVGMMFLISLVNYQALLGQNPLVLHCGGRVADGRDDLWTEILRSAALD